MLNWERVPLVGANPLFHLELKRVWGRRSTRLLFALILILAPVVWVALLRDAFALTRAFGSVDWWWGLWAADTWAYEESSAPDAGTALLAHQFPLGPDAWYARAACLLTVTLAALVKAGARYLIPALAAASVATDRATGRLEPLVVSQMSSAEIVWGKAMAPAAPFAVLGLVAVVPIAMLTLARPAVFGPLTVLLAAELLMTLAAGGLIGLRVGLSPRRDVTVATAASVFIAGVLAPIAVGGLSLGVASLMFEAARAIGASPALGCIYATAAHVVVWCGVLAFLWMSAKQAVERVAEWDRSAQG